MIEPTLADAFVVDARWTVYECVALDGIVLYVGMTGRGGARLAEHMGKPWWTAVETILLRHYTSQALAREGERQLIAAERPLFNTAGRPSGSPSIVQTPWQMVEEIATLRAAVTDLEARLGEFVG